MTRAPWFLLAVFGLLGTLVPESSFGDPPPTPTPVPSSRRSLSDYARGRNLQRSTKGGESATVITDDNLKEMASGIELTSVTQKTSNSSDPDVILERNDPRTFWRKRVQQQLETIRALELETNTLRSEIAGLWEMFYASDRPDEREGEIRPRLVQKIERQTDLGGESEAARIEYQDLMEEARKDGALPGWFRDLGYPPDGVGPH